MFFYKDFSSKIDELKKNNNYRTLIDYNKIGKFICFENKNLINLSSNDYLGISNNEEIKINFLDYLKSNDKNHLFGSAASRLVTGNHLHYSLLEKKLATLYGFDSALIFNSGFVGNLGIISTISDAKTLIISDRFNHASIIDGIKFSKANFTRYNHLDYNHLEKILIKEKNNYEKILVVTESIFSMDGDVADLLKIIDLKKKYGFLIYLDEAHAFGVLGNNGLGLCESLNCIKDIDFIFATFGKAFSSQGGFLISNQITRDYLINFCRPFIYSTSLPPITLIWNLFLLENNNILKNLRKKLNENLNYLTQKVKELNLEIKIYSQIFPVIIGTNDNAIFFSEYLKKEGILGVVIRPPTVPEHTSRIRFSITSIIQKEDIDLLLQKINKFLNEQNINKK